MRTLPGYVEGIEASMATAERHAVLLESQGFKFEAIEVRKAIAKIGKLKAS